MRCTGQTRLSVSSVSKTHCGACLKRDGTCAETRVGLSTKRTSPFKLAGGRGGGRFSRLLAAELCASAVVMLDTPCSDVECKTTGYPLHAHVSPTVRHRVPSGFNWALPLFFEECESVKRYGTISSICYTYTLLITLLGILENIKIETKIIGIKPFTVQLIHSNI
jgi:hypothetical protein